MTARPEPVPTQHDATGTAGTAGTADTVGAAPVQVTERCTACGGCLLTCPQRAIRPLGGTLLIRGDLCDGCGECIEVCPVDAITEVDALAEADALPAAGPDSPPGGVR